MNVRAKFFCSRKSENQAYPNTAKYAVVELSPATGQGNESWSKYTPSGNIEMTINNPVALAAFVIGQSYFVDFTPAEVPGPAPAPVGQPQVD
jgi:hypothetical protein